MKDETELQTASRWQMGLPELSHSGEVEICSKKLSSEHASHFEVNFETSVLYRSWPHVQGSTVDHTAFCRSGLSPVNGLGEAEVETTINAEQETLAWYRKRPSFAARPSRAFGSIVRCCRTSRSTRNASVRLRMPSRPQTPPTGSAARNRAGSTSGQRHQAHRLRNMRRSRARPARTRATLHW